MIGLSELFVIAVVVMAILRPDKLAGYTESIRKAARAAREMQEEARSVVDVEAAEAPEPEGQKEGGPGQ